MRKLSAIQNFYTLGEIKLTKIQTCGQHLLCPFCAAIRASRAITDTFNVLTKSYKKIAN